MNNNKKQQNKITLKYGLLFSMNFTYCNCILIKSCIFKYSSTKYKGDISIIPCFSY